MMMMNGGNIDKPRVASRTDNFTDGGQKPNYTKEVARSSLRVSQRFLQLEVLDVNVPSQTRKKAIPATLW